MNSLKIGIWNADGLCHHKLELVQFLIKEMLSDVGRGGAVIIIRSNLIHHPLSFTSQANAQAVAISLRNNSDLTIAAIYLKPGGRQDTIDDAQLLDIFLGLGPRFIIGGDFNARHGFWGCQKSCKRGRAIANLSQSQNWNILATGAPTSQWRKFAYENRLQPPYFVECTQLSSYQNFHDFYIRWAAVKLDQLLTHIRVIEQVCEYN
ncbi:hypothetical protein ACLKA6_010217 [Drosophila palustris]